jgi:aminopeptidase
MDIRIQRLAHLLVDYSVEIQPGERVAILSSPAAADLVRPVYERVLERGGYPFLSIDLPGMEEIFYRVASDEQLKFISPVERIIFEEYEVLISIRAATNTRELNDTEPSRQTMRNKARRPLMQTYMERSAAGKLKWSGTLFPTPAYAQEADMSLRDYENFVYSACYCNLEDPIAAWQTVHNEQAQVIQWLNGREQVKIVGPNADLALSIKDRTFINSDGHHNMPSGEIFTGPVETSAHGWVKFTYPAISGGREVNGIELTFEDGKVVEAQAEKNEEYLLKMLDTDEGSRYLGEFAIGTNFGIQRFTKNILFDEKIGGSFHLALGSGYPETGSQNRSSIHWDMICDMREGGEIWVDNELLYQSGEFKI